MLLRLCAIGGVVDRAVRVLHAAPWAAAASCRALSCAAPLLLPLPGGRDFLLCADCEC
jgi:hypothetical protein